MNAQGRNLLGLLAMGAIAAGLSLYAYLGVQKPGEAAARREDAQTRLIGAKDGELDPGRLTVTLEGEATTLEKREDGWWVTSPVLAPADGQVVEQLLAALREGRLGEPLEEAPSAEDLARYGLSPARFVVEAPGGRLEGGLENPFDGSYFVRRAGHPAVRTVPGGVGVALARSTFDLRGKDVLAFEADALAGLTVKKGRAEPWRLERGEDGAGWRLLSPRALDADDEAIEALLSSLRGQRARAFPEDSAEARARLGLESPVLVAWVTRKDGTTVRLSFARAPAEDGGPRKAFLLREEGEAAVLAELSPAVIERLELDPLSLRDRRVLRFDQAQVAVIELSGGGHPTVRLRRGAREGGADTWIMESPEEGPAQRWKVASLFWSLEKLRASSDGGEKPRSPSRHGLADGARRVTLWAADGALLASLRIGAEVPGKPGTRYVQGSAERVLEVDATRLDELPWTVEALVQGPAAGE